MIIDYEYKYNKYKSRYLQLKSLLETYKGSNFLTGGADKTKDKAKDKTKSKKHGDNKEMDNNLLNIKCVEVHQKEKDKIFDGVMCKTPPIKIRFKTNEVKMAFVVKSLLRLVNKSLRIKNVKSVKITEINKKLVTLQGDKLSESIDLSKTGIIEKIVIDL